MSRAAAFFDMDLTLLRCNSGTAWIRFLRERGEITTGKMLRALWWIGRYKLSLIDLEAVSRIAIADLAGDAEAEMLAKARLFFAREVVPNIAPLGRQAITHHRAAGHVLAILSSSTPYIVQPLAELLGVEHVLCTRLHVEQGRFTGGYDAPACAGLGKVHWAERFAAAQDIDLSASWFYTDSYTDLPMLERVGVRKVINPDTRLRRHARRAGWEVQTW